MSSEANLVANPGFLGQSDGWTFVTPRPELAPGHSVRDGAAGRRLAITATGDKHAFGCWRGEAKLEVGEWYRATVRVKAKGVENPSLSVFAQAADHFLVPRGAWSDETILEQVFKHSVEGNPCWFEVYLRAAESGEIEFREPRVVRAPAPEPRIVRVATARFGEAPRGLTVEGQRERIIARLDQAGALKPDIVCLPEFCPITGVDKEHYESVENMAEEVPGGAMSRMLSDKAKEYGMHVMAGVIERDGKHVFNTGALFDRRGEFVGVYRKTHPMFAENQMGISSGDSYPVFDLDFGRVAVHICYDEWFPEVSRYYAHHGAEILFLLVAGGKPITWRTRALDNAMYFVSSSVNPPSMIINSTGEILAETHGDGVAFADLDLNYRQVNWYRDPTFAYSMPCIVPQMRNTVDHELIDGLAKALREARK